MILNYNGKKLKTITPAMPEERIARNGCILNLMSSTNDSAKIIHPPKLNNSWTFPAHEAKLLIEISSLNNAVFDTNIPAVKIKPTITGLIP